MLRNIKIIFCSLFVSTAVLATESQVELSYGLQPNRDVFMDTSTETVTTMRVLEDRGLVAKSGGRIRATPMTVVTKRKQTFRYITSQVAADGSFSAEMQVVDQTSFVQGADGKEQSITDSNSLKGATFLAIIDGTGSIRPDSIKMQGVNAEMSKLLIPVFQSIFAQKAAAPSILLSPDKETPQDIAMQIPIPGFASFDMKMKILHSLLGVEQGIAKIQQVFRMEFGSGPAGTKLTADGTGGGLIAFDTLAKQILSHETSTVMRMLLTMADGTLEFHLSVKQAQNIRPPVESTK